MRQYQIKGLHEVIANCENPILVMPSSEGLTHLKQRGQPTRSNKTDVNSVGERNLYAFTNLRCKWGEFYKSVRTLLEMKYTHYCGGKNTLDRHASVGH